jgi:hypothetical protein
MIEGTDSRGRLRLSADSEDVLPSRRHRRDQQRKYMEEKENADKQNKERKEKRKRALKESMKKKSTTDFMVEKRQKLKEKKTLNKEDSESEPPSCSVVEATNTLKTNESEFIKSILGK